jgi:hypothetical protein
MGGGFAADFYDAGFIPEYASDGIAALIEAGCEVKDRVMPLARVEHESSCGYTFELSGTTGPLSHFGSAVYDPEQGLHLMR